MDVERTCALSKWHPRKAWTEDKHKQNAWEVGEADKPRSWAGSPAMFPSRSKTENGIEGRFIYTGPWGRGEQSEGR